MNELTFVEGYSNFILQAGFQIVKVTVKTQSSFPKLSSHNVTMAVSARESKCGHPYYTEYCWGYTKLGDKV